MGDEYGLLPSAHPSGCADGALCMEEMTSLSPYGAGSKAGSFCPVANSFCNLPVQSVGVSEWVCGVGECYHCYHG